MERSNAPEPTAPGIELRPAIADLPGTGRILIAFSGGPDSVCLAALIAQSRLERPVACIHVDHQLDPDSHRRARRAERIARNLGLDCRIVLARPTDLNGPEASARHARYQALADALAPGDVLLTAHHADDQAETILLRLLRGSGPDGLAGIPAQRRFARGWIARPLLEQSRGAIMAWLQTEGLDWVEDPANEDRRFDRNALRHDIMPLLTRRWPGVERAIRRSGVLSRGASEALAELAAADLGLCMDSNQRIELACLMNLSTYRQASAIRRWCIDSGAPPPPGPRLDELLSQIRRASIDRCPELRWKDYILRAWGGLLWLDATIDIPEDWAAQWRGDKPLSLPGPLGCLRLEAASPVSLDRIEVRLGSSGESLVLPGRRHGCLVKELMRKAGIPPWQRVLWPRLWRGDQLLAVGGRWLTAAFRDELESHSCRLVWRSKIRPAGVH